MAEFERTDEDGGWRLTKDRLERIILEGVENALGMGKLNAIRDGNPVAVRLDAAISRGKQAKSWRRTMTQCLQRMARTELDPDKSGRIARALEGLAEADRLASEAPQARKRST
jgi:hypothetical protein